MGVPVSYNLRNLVERKASTIMTALGIALTVAVLVTCVALTQGLNSVFANTADPLNVMVLRKGSDAELTSTVTTEAYDIIRDFDGIALSPAGEKMVSQEGLAVVSLTSPEAPDGMNVTVRGLLDVGLQMRPLKIEQGKAFDRAHREVIVGSAIAKRYPDAAIGNEISFGAASKGKWKVVGVFSSGDSAANSEIWVGLTQLLGDFERQGGSSSLLIHAISPAAVNTLKDKITADQRLGVQALTESDYYKAQTQSGDFLEILGFAVAIIMAIGSAFAATNTMYAAVSRRTREIGTLRALGFNRLSILTSFLLESVFLALIGGIVGVLLAMPINGLAAGVGNFVTFSDVTFKFKVGPWAIFWGLAFSATIGALGGFLPAFAASRKSIVQAMRDL